VAAWDWPDTRTPGGAAMASFRLRAAEASGGKTAERVHGWTACLN
jgi:hypothetical protein